MDNSLLISEIREEISRSLNGLLPVVLDPFAGSGTAAVTAKKLGRHFVAVEREPQFCLWAEQRLERAETDRSIQGYRGGVFWERNAAPGAKG